MSSCSSTIVDITCSDENLISDEESFVGTITDNLQPFSENDDDE